MAVISYWLHCEVRQNDTILKPAFEGNAVIFGIAYSLVLLAALTLNIAYLFTVWRLWRKLHSLYYICFYLAMSCLVNLFSSCLMLPLSYLVHMTFWHYGPFLCKSIPVAHKFVTSMTLALLLCMAMEKYREVVRTAQPIAYWVTLPLACVLSAGAAIPGTMFTEYHWLQVKGFLLEQCVLTTSSMGEYARAMFVLGYCLPFLGISLLLIHVSRQMTTQQLLVSYQRRSDRVTIHHRDSQMQSALDFDRERLVLRSLSIITALVALLWLPLNILSLVQLVMPSDPDEGCKAVAMADLIYAILVLFSFLPAVTSPLVGLLFLRQPMVILSESDQHVALMGNEIRRAAPTEAPTALLDVQGDLE